MSQSDHPDASAMHAATGDAKSEGRFRILAIDGGGLRGVIPSIVLREIEKRTNRPSHQLFDLIAGTSTGGLIALAVAKSEPKSASQLVDFYRERGGTIFKHHFMDSIRRFIWAEYRPRELELALDDVFGDSRLSDTLTNVFATSYELDRRAPKFFKSYSKKPDDFLLRDVARATSAAPTYFPPATFEIHDENGVARQGLFVDGGIFANNPGVCAWVEAEVIAGVNCPKTIISLGTGDPVEDLMKPRRPLGWGALRWANPMRGIPLLNVMFDSSAETVDHQLTHLRKTSADHHHYRFNLDLRHVSEAMDDVKAVPCLIRRTEEYVARKDISDLLDECCAQL